MVTIRLTRGEWFYDPARPLGRPGGFGAVFEGESPSGLAVAVKRLHVSAAEAAHRELKIADDLVGRPFSHVLPVLDAGQDAESGNYFIVMLRADRSLADLLNRAGGRLAFAEAVDVLRQVASGLCEVPHIVHRDLKPGNVLLHEAAWKIADFGIARFVEEATSLNTVKDFLSAAYAAPEQWRLERATSATDVYALGCIAHELVNGVPPFRGPDFREAHLNETPPSLVDVDPRFRSIISAALRKPQAGRPSAERVRAVMREVQDSPLAPSPALAALRDANAAEAERLSREAARAEAVRAAVKEHEALIEAGLEAHREIAARLESAVRENAPEARIFPKHIGALRIELGEAVLELHDAQGLARGIELRCAGWEPIAGSQISVKQGREWEHAATLLWMRPLGRGGELRWYEISFQRHVLHNLGPPVGPFAMRSLGDADAAMGPGAHLTVVEAGPTPIDGEAMEAFVERWLARFALAHSSRLRPR